MKGKKPPFIKGKQLSFINTLLADERRETLFIDTALEHFKNIKWLRSRIRFSSFSQERKLYCQTYLSGALELASTVIYTLSRKTIKYSHYKHEDFIRLLFIDPDHLYKASPDTPQEIKDHHEKAYTRLVGVFLAYKDVLKKHKDRTDKILEFMVLSNDSLNGYIKTNAI